MTLKWDAANRRWELNGRKVTLQQQANLRNELADMYSKYLRHEADLYNAGKLEFANWRANSERYILEATGNGYQFGRGGVVNMSDADYDRLARTLNKQVELFQNFAEEVRTGQLSVAQIAARADSYGGSVVYAHEQALNQAAIGDDPNADWELPFYPGDGDTQCLCITTPESRVATTRGMVPIADVVVGDYVLTHRKRWRRVTDIHRNSSNPRHRQAWLVSPNGSRVGCTDDHRFLTPRGWIPANSIDNATVTRYNYAHEELHKVWNTTRQSITDGYLSVVSPLVRMWESEGRSSGVVPIVRNERQSQGAMGKPRFSSEDHGRHRGIGARAKDALFGSDMGFIQSGQGGRWPNVHVLLGRFQPQAVHLSLSMGMASGAWSDTSRYGSPSQEYGLHRRPSRELGTRDYSTASKDSRDTRTESQDARGARRVARPDYRVDMRTVRETFHGEAASGSVATLLFASMPDSVNANLENMPDMWTDVHRWSSTWETPEVLQSGVLPLETVLYDITVDEDESFVLEGMVVHNSRCRCAWEINENEYAWTCIYHTIGDESMCADCIARGQQYGEGSPLVFPKANAPMRTRDLEAA